MATIDSRLDQVQNLLIPKQAVIAWLEDVRQRFESLDDYWAWILKRPDDDFPTHSLARQIETSIRARTKGADEKKIKTALRRAAREVVFLFDLCVYADQYFASHSQPIGLMAIPALEGLLSATETRNLSDLGRWSDYQSYFRVYALEVFNLKAAIEHIERTYFDGQSLLCKTRAEELNFHIANIDQLASAWNELLLLFRRNPELNPRRGKGKQKSLGPPELDFDMEALKKSVDPVGRTTGLIGCAKAEALAMIGDTTAAISILRSSIRIPS